MDPALDALLTAVGAPPLTADDDVLDLAAVRPDALAEAPDLSADVIVAADALRGVPGKLLLRYVVEIARVLRIEGWAAFALSTDPVDPAQRHSRRGMLRTLVGAEPQRAADFVPLDALGATAVQAGLRLDRIEGANTRDTLVLAFKDSN